MSPREDWNLGQPNQKSVKFGGSQAYTPAKRQIDVGFVHSQNLPHCDCFEKSFL